MSEEITPEQIRQVLDLDLGPNDSGASTGRGYLLRLLEEVWTVQEGFSGKRPFGNSSWDYDLKTPMVRAGLVSGHLDSDGCIEHIDERAADALVLAAIKALDGPGSEPQPAKVIVVRDEAGREHRYAAPNFGMLHDGTLVIGDKRDDGELRVDAARAPGRWASAHKDDVAAPDSTATALGIARRALEEISKTVLEASDPRREVVRVARVALEEIFTETEL